MRIPASVAADQLFSFLIVLFRTLNIGCVSVKHEDDIAYVIDIIIVIASIVLAVRDAGDSAHSVGTA